MGTADQHRNPSGAKDKNEAEGAGAVKLSWRFHEQRRPNGNRYDETQMQSPQLRGVTLDKIPSSVHRYEGHHQHADELHPNRAGLRLQ
ncbi:portal protein [Pseudomonas phage PIP]|nr:portal protein [Pseudomonas phage PIP]